MAFIRFIVLLLLMSSCTSKPDEMAEDEYHSVLEVDADKFGSRFFIGWQEDSTSKELTKKNWMEPYSGGRRCAFGIADKNGDLNSQFSHFNKDYTWSGNPSVLTISDSKIVVVCMSAQAPFLGRGILEIKYTSDSGKSWSGWVSVYQTEDGSADKPVLYRLSNEKFAMAFVKFDATPDKEIEVNGKKYQKNKLKGQLHYIAFDFSTPEVKQLHLAKKVPVQNFSSQASGQVSGHYTVDMIGLHSGGAIGVLTGRHKADPFYFLQLDPDGNWTTKKIQSMNVDAPVCRLAARDRKLIAIVCYEAHSHSSMAMALSRDGGTSWSLPLEIDPKGSLGALQFISNSELVVVWQSLGNRNIVFKTAHFSTLLKKVKEGQLGKIKRPDNSEHFIGAYQDLVYSPTEKRLTFFGVGVEWSGTQKIIQKDFKP